MSGDLASEACGALLDYARACEMPYQVAYRSGSRILVTDGRLVLRVTPEHERELEPFDEFPMHAELRAWRFPVLLFRSDVKTLSDWAANDMPLLGPCPVDGESGHDGSCELCDGTGYIVGDPAFGWITSKRVVDRRYVELIAACASDTDVVEVKARSHDPTAGLRFRGTGWDAFLMPFAKLPPGADAAAPLWTPQPVLQGEHA